MSGHRSKSLDEFVGREFDYVITVCDAAREACPVFPGAKRQLHWSIEDPAEAEARGESAHEAFRKARDELRQRIEEFVRTELASPA